jgi:putative tricarboxylic transport membrane protein
VGAKAPATAVNRLLRAGDFWAAAAFAALGAYIVSEARAWVYLGEEGPGAGFFPMWYGIAMLVLSFALVVGSALKLREGHETPGVRWKGVGRALACWAALAACVALLKLAGFIVSFALLSWFIVAILCRKRARIAIVLSIGWAVLFWLIFSWGLDMSLPAGRFF